MGRLHLICILVMFAGCIIEPIPNPGPLPPPVDPVVDGLATKAEMSMRVYARLVADGLDEIDWTNEATAGKAVARQSIEARQAAGREINDIFQSDAVRTDGEWDPAKAKAVARELKRGFQRVGSVTD
jgi:hypothetical protein